MRTYSVPRRFGLATLLVATLAFSALSAVFRWLEWPAGVVLAILAFIGIVSAAQFAFDKRPRLASAGAGSVCFVLMLAASVISNAEPLNSGVPTDLMFIVIWMAFWGAIAGYVTGTMIGSVFLMMDAVSTAFMKRPDDQEAKLGG